MKNVDTSLSELATTLPAASRVFRRHRLDFCCHGERSLAAACVARDLDPAQILAEIDAEAKDLRADGPRFAELPLAELVEHIIHHYHEPLREDLDRLLEMARRVERVHAERASCPKGLALHLERFADAVRPHLAKEEAVLFPMIASGRGAMAGGPVRMMRMEHEEHGEALTETRALTNDLVPPAEACATWRALYLGLEQLEADLMDHIHLENAVLFPRALAG